MRSKAVGIGGAMAVVVALLALVLTFACVPTIARAEDEGEHEATEQEATSENEEEQATNETEEGNEETQSSLIRPLGGLPLTGEDYVWFGRDLEITHSGIANDLIAAGQIIHLSDVTASGSIRAAAQTINIAESTAHKNITVAAQNVSLHDVSAMSVAAAGETIEFSGTCDELTAYANHVFIDGTVNGDVMVGAETVEIGTNARIAGTLHVSSASEPVMQRGAEVADVDYTEVDTTADDVAETAASATSAFTIMLIIAGILGTPIIALLAEWLFRHHTATAAEMIRTRTGATIASGIVGTLVAPVIVILLLLLVLTAPVSIALTLALIAMAIVASGFAGASVFRLAFPKLGRYVCALAGGAIMGVACAIPYLGHIVRFAAFAYLLGYVLQSIFLRLHTAHDKAPKTPEAPTETPQL